MPQSGDLRLARSFYFSAKFLAQAMQNVWLAALFIVAGTGAQPALDLSSLFVAIVLPAIILGLPGGALADRLGPGWGLFTGAVLRLAPLLIAIAVLDQGPMVWVLAFAYSASLQVFDPSEMALVRALQRNHAGRAHTMLVVLQYAGQGTGMLIFAPALYFMGGTDVMVTGAAAGTVLLIVLTGLLALRVRHIPSAAPVTTSKALRFGDVLSYFRREHLARYALVSLGLKMAVSRAAVVALPVYISGNLDVGVPGLTALFVPGVLGLAAGLWWCSRNVTLERVSEVMRWSLAGTIAGMAALAALDIGLGAAAHYSQVGLVQGIEASMVTFVVAFPVAFLLGACLAGSHIAPRVTLTETAPRGQQARVFAVQLTLTEAIILIPLVLAGVGTTYAGARVTFAVIAVLVAGVLLLIELDRLRSERAKLPSLPEALTPDGPAVTAQAKG